MKFIFPQNYNFKNKLFGIIDYTTIFINIIWFAFILLIINLLFKDLTIKVFIFIIFSLPVFLFSISGFNGESIFIVFLYLLKFIFRQKVFFFSKKTYR